MDSATILVCTTLAIALACSAPADPGRGAAAPTAAPARQASEEPPEIDADAGAELSGVLRDYFGEFRAPRFRVLDRWEAIGFDPNRSPFDGARPASDVSQSVVDAIRADNRSFWSAELAAIEALELDAVGPWPRMEFTSRAWRELLAQRRRVAPQELQRRAESFFAERYPGLEEAAQLFVANCARCHGPQGGGDGPFAARLDPKPRDYRRGVFKFAAVDPGSKPRRADLLRTLVHGLPGSAMPSFRRSALADLHALIDYVRYLAIRGEVESRLAAEWEIAEIRPRDAIAEQYELVWRRWLEAEAHGRTVVAPPVDPDPARLALGDEVFHDTRRGNCVTCHGPAGRGDGVSALGVDAGGHRYTLLRDEWQNPILPRDLARGIFRGGSSREDIYLRIHCGIPGTPMPSLGSSLDARGEPLLSEREKWAVVDYVLSLSGRGPFASAAPR